MYICTYIHTDKQAGRQAGRQINRHIENGGLKIFPKDREPKKRGVIRKEGGINLLCKP